MRVIYHFRTNRQLLKIIRVLIRVCQSFFLVLLPYTRHQCDYTRHRCDNAQKGESLTILGPTDKVSDRDLLGLGVTFFLKFGYHKHATTVTRLRRGII